MSDRRLSPSQIDAEILRLSDAMEKRTDLLATHAEEAADAEVEYRQAQAKANLRAAVMSGSGKDGRTTVDERKSIVDSRCEAEMRRYKIAENLYDVDKEILRTMRSQIDALRTVAANIRVQT